MKPSSEVCNACRSTAVVSRPWLVGEQIRYFYSIRRRTAAGNANSSSAAAELIGESERAAENVAATAAALLFFVNENGEPTEGKGGPLTTNRERLLIDSLMSSRARIPSKNHANVRSVVGWRTKLGWSPNEGNMQGKERRRKAFRFVSRVNQMNGSMASKELEARVLLAVTQGCSCVGMVFGKRCGEFGRRAEIDNERMREKRSRDYEISASIPFPAAAGIPILMRRK